MKFQASDATYLLLLPQAIYLLVTCASAVAAPSKAVVTLAEGIHPYARHGAPVRFQDDRCRYSGELVRETGMISANSSLLDLAGGDSGAWHVRITAQSCHEEGGELVRFVDFRVPLPRPPAMAGGGGIPPLPRGYQAGTRFEMLKP